MSAPFLKRIQHAPARASSRRWKAAHCSAVVSRRSLGSIVRRRRPHVRRRGPPDGISGARRLPGRRKGRHRRVDRHEGGAGGQHGRRPVRRARAAQPRRHVRPIVRRRRRNPDRAPARRDQRAERAERRGDPGGGSLNQGARGFGNFAVARFHPDGSTDASFGDNGVATADFADVPYGNFDVVPDLVADAAGNIAVAGTAKIVYPAMEGPGDRLSSRQAIAVARFTPNGALDAHFSVGQTPPN
jgi:hypothetical protein